MRIRYSIILLLVLVLAIGFFAHHATKIARVNNAGKSNVEVKKTELSQLVCKDEIDVISDRDELMTKAGSYFGGSDIYSLQCAAYAYWASISADPTDTNPLVWYQLGRIDFLYGDLYSAMAKFDRQIELHGDTPPNVYYMIGLTNGYSARKTGNEAEWKKGEEGFKKFLEYFPESPWGRTDLAWIYFAQGKFEEMKPVVGKGLETSPDNPWLLNMYGLAFLNTGEKVKAHEYFVRAGNEAEKLTPDIWGKSYPGNDPQSWSIGLSEMQKAINHNIEVSKNAENDSSI